MMMLWLNEQFVSVPIFWALTSCLIIQLLAWGWQKHTQNADVVDIGWTLGIIVSVTIYLLVHFSWTVNQVLVMLFPVAWYLRLLWHLINRYDVAQEDGRYQNLRSHWSENTQLKFLLFFIFQALLSVLFSLPAWWVVQTELLYSWQIGLALLIGLSALCGVTLADRQLLRFKRENETTKVCDIGLWRYSRHPNYFFEWMHWWVYPILLWNSDNFWWSVGILLLMLLFLLKLTGIPFSEQQAIKRRGQAYIQYMKQTNKFIPWDFKK